jgi:CubicO group peptidase (beta-lactamase class C family)
MQLAESGKLDIDDPINKYLDELANNELSSNNNPVTFRHLLSHHSGLKGPSFESIPVWERKPSRLLKTLTSKITSEELPGKSFKYCNPCYGLLGLLIERISGVSYQEYIVKKILKPLKIQSEGPVTPTPEMVEELALPYKLENNKPLPIYQSKLDVFPAGDIYLTPNEMANFYIAQLNQGEYKGLFILKPRSINELQKGQFDSSYGLGIGVINDNNGNYLQHAGEVPGFSTFFVAEKKSKRGVYIAANAGDSYKTLGIIANLALKLLNGDKDIKPLPSFTKKEYTEMELSEEVLEKYIGKYQITPQFFIEITKVGKQLFGQATGQGKFQMFAYEKDKFFLKVVDAKVHFHIEGDKIKGLTFFQNGKTEGVKVE